MKVSVKSYLDLPGSPMNVKEVGYFVDCTMRDEKDKAAGLKFSFDDKVASELGSNGYVVKNRLNVYQASASFVVGCLIINLSRGEQDLVMWCWTLSKIFRKNAGIEVDFDTFVDSFKSGIPNYNLRMQLFRSQLIKGGNDCLLNHPEQLLFD